MILLDTHVALWIATQSPALGARSKALAQEAATDGRLAISAISFWEIALLIARGRFETTKSAAQLRAEMIDASVVELPLSGDISIRAVELQNLHGDPADRFIVATAIAHDANLLTADKALLRWRHTLKRQDAAK
ncbi:MAG: type II toxin-antitoxin system VapC family toxin [Xanthobacteraceae bacterium]|nr:type II toxin-antitoxin system VapC family toxin [Xanthobacteraceae bacterium]